MAIRLICVCGRTIALPRKAAGGKARCPDCRKVLNIPSPEEDQGLTRWYCECGQRLKARTRAAGRRITCPRCGVETAVPALDEDASTISEEFLIDDSDVIEMPPVEGETVEAVPVGEEEPLELEPFSSAPVRDGQTAEEDAVEAELVAEEDEPDEEIYDVEEAAVPVSTATPAAAAAATGQPSFRTPAAAPRPAAPVYDEDSDEGLSARELTRYFNAEGGIDAARSGILEVINGHWLYFPYALISGVQTVLMQILLGLAQESGQSVLAFGLVILNSLLGLFLLAGLFGCIKDGIFNRYMGIGRLIHHSIFHSLRFAGTVLLMAPVGIAMGVGYAAAVAGIMAIAGQDVLLFLILLALLAFPGLVGFTVFFIPPVVAVVENANPFVAFGRGMKFAVTKVFSLFVLTIVVMFGGGGLVFVIWFFWWIFSILLLLFLPPWLYQALQTFMGSLVIAGVFGLIFAAVMILYLSHLPEERLRAIHIRLRGPPPRPGALYITMAILSVLLLLLSYLHYGEGRGPFMRQPTEQFQGIEDEIPSGL